MIALCVQKLLHRRIKSVDSLILFLPTSTLFSVFLHPKASVHVLPPGFCIYQEETYDVVNTCTFGSFLASCCYPAAGYVMIESMIQVFMDKQVIDETKQFTVD